MTYQYTRDCQRTLLLLSVLHDEIHSHTQSLWRGLHAVLCGHRRGIKQTTHSCDSSRIMNQQKHGGYTEISETEPNRSDSRRSAYVHKPAGTCMVAHVCMYVCMHAGMYVHAYVQMCVCVCVCMHMHIFTYGLCACDVCFAHVCYACLHFDPAYAYMRRCLYVPRVRLLVRLDPLSIN